MTRVGKTVFLEQQDSKVGMGRRIAGMQRDDALEELASRTARALAVEHAAKAAERLRMRRSPLQHAPVGMLGIVEGLFGLELPSSVQKQLDQSANPLASRCGMEAVR